MVLIGLSVNEALTIGEPSTIRLSWLSSPPLATLALVACYVIGHLCQAMGNALPALNRLPEDDFLAPNDFPPALLERATTILGLQLTIDASLVNLEHRVALMDQIRRVAGNGSDHEVFVYREGFYRGMTVATGLIVLALVARLLFAYTSLQFANDRIQLDRSDNILLILACTGAVALFRARMRRFGRYRVQWAVEAFLAAATRGRSGSPAA